MLGLPHAEIMGGIGLLALSTNLASVLLLLRYKDGDANVRSVWLCSRNDAMACVFLTSSMQILRQAWYEWQEATTAARETVL